MSEALITRFEALTDSEKWGVACAVRYDLTPARSAAPLAAESIRRGTSSAFFTPLVSAIARELATTKGA